MSTVYLVRHGQAGTRESYDSLSAVGRQQARLLGEYFVAQQIQPQRLISGSLQRQHQTAHAVRTAYINAGMTIAELETDPEWDEFDLDRVYRDIAPQLCQQDAVFAREYSAMKEEIRASAGTAEARVHRQWFPCDIKVVEAWTSGRYKETGETWVQFQKRIAGCAQRVHQKDTMIFSSATPMGIWGALAMDIFDARAMRLAGAVNNSAFSEFRVTTTHVRIRTFNATPHLPDAKLRTQR